MRLWTVKYVKGTLELVESKFRRNWMKFAANGSLHLTSGGKVRARIPMSKFNNYTISKGYNEKVMVFDDGFPIDRTLALKVFIEDYLENIQKTKTILENDLRALEHEQTTLYLQLSKMLEKDEADKKDSDSRDRST